MGEAMTVPHFAAGAWQYVFNTPLECGLRCVALLLAARPQRWDLQRIVQSEYLLVHSGDVPGGPPSLHPSSPHRVGELLVRRGLVERALLFMMSRQVVCRALSSSGIHYFAGDHALPFFDALQSAYSRQLLSRAAWVVERFGEVPSEDLDNYMRAHWSDWGAEFTHELFVRGASD
ncbi:MAG: threonine transporter [Phycisphaerales bacterium]|nr:threonine transporter [Phycisphaerales bacterium]